MKQFALILCILFMLSLCGCGKAASAPPPAQTLPEAPTEAAPTEATELPKEEETTPPGVVIDTEYYYIPLYDAWAASCVVEFHTMHSGLPVVTLYEKTAHEAFGGGKLCSIQLMPTSDDTYKDFPSYEVLGVLDTPEESLRVIVLFPTDVQYDADTADAYNVMAAELMDVLWQISPREGIELAMPAPTE